MYIEKIHISSFGKLHDTDIELSKGVNIIEGSNEAGKSTVAAFIKFAFYGLSNKTNGGALSERERYVSWDTGYAGGYLILACGENRYRVERLLSIVGQTGNTDDKKPAYRETVGITELSSNSPVKTKSSPGEYFFGVDEEVFSKTAYVGQLEGVKVSGEKMTQAIENMLFTADENVNIQKALKKLDSARVAYLHKNQKGGKIFEREQEYAALEARLNEVKQINADILAKESSLEDANTRFEEIKASLGAISAAVKSFDNKNIIASFDALREFEKKCDQAAEKEAKFAEKYTKNGFLPNREYLNSIKKLKNSQRLEQERLEELSRRLDDARSQKAELERAYLESSTVTDRYEQDIEFCEKGLRELALMGKLSIAFFVMAVLLALGGAICVGLYIFMPIGKLVMAYSALPLACAAVCLILRAAKKAGVRKVLKQYSVDHIDELKLKQNELKSRNGGLELAQSKITELEEELEARREGFSENERQLDEMLDRCAASDLELIEAELEEYEAASAERVKNSEKAELLKNQLYQYDEAEIRSADQTVADDITPENITEKRRELAFLTNQSRAMETRIHELEKELAGLMPQSESSARLAERAELNREIMIEYRFKHAAYLLAYEKISEASESMRADISPRLAKETCITMGEITGGKYTELGVDSELNLSVTADGITRRLDTLSAGTQDAAYVSLRLALMNSLFSESMPSVVFDESFSRLDEARLNGILILTQSLAKKSVQSIILTSGKREAELMSKIGEFSRILI